MTEETKLTEPVQVGLWYETAKGCITRIDEYTKGLAYPYEANNSTFYTADGKKYKQGDSLDDLIRCLGADPFNQVNISKTETTTQFERIFTAVLGGQVANVLPIDDDHIKNMVSGAIKLTQEAIKQLKEIGE